MAQPLAQPVAQPVRTGVFVTLCGLGALVLDRTRRRAACSVRGAIRPSRYDYESYGPGRYGYGRYEP